MLVVGGIMFASELSQFTPYDIFLNERELPVIKKSEVYDISDLEGPIYFSNDYYIGDHYGNGYNSDIFDTDEISIFADEDQTEGSITIEVAYLSDVGLNNCRINFGNGSDDYYGHNAIMEASGKHHMMHKDDNKRRKISSDYSVDKNRIVVGALECDNYFVVSNANFFMNENFKYFMREKQLPVVLSKMVIAVNPNDLHKFR